MFSRPAISVCGGRNCSAFCGRPSRMLRSVCFFGLGTVKPVTNCLTRARAMGVMYLLAIRSSLWRTNALDSLGLVTAASWEKSRSLAYSSGSEMSPRACFTRSSRGVPSASFMHANFQMKGTSFASRGQADSSAGDAPRRTALGGLHDLSDQYSTLSYSNCSASTAKARRRGTSNWRRGSHNDVGLTQLGLSPDGPWPKGNETGTTLGGGTVETSGVVDASRGARLDTLSTR